MTSVDLNEKVNGVMLRFWIEMKATIATNGNTKNARAADNNFAFLVKCNALLSRV